MLRRKVTLLPPFCMCFVHMHIFELSFYHMSQYFSVFAKGKYSCGVFGIPPLLCVGWIFPCSSFAEWNKACLCFILHSSYYRIDDGILFCCFVAISQEKKFYLFILTTYWERDMTRCLLGCWRFSCHILYPKAIPRGNKNQSFRMVHLNLCTLPTWWLYSELLL